MTNSKDFVISFVRHAQSCGNAGITYEPEFHRDDPPLSETGLIEAQMLGNSVLTDSVTHIFSSSLIRAVQTAYPTAEKLSKEIILLPDLMEVDTQIPGTDISLLNSKYPLAVPCIEEPTPCGGGLYLGVETTADLVSRGKRCVDYFYRNARDGDHFMVVSHGSFFGYLIRAALGISLPETFCWQVDNCCMTRIIFRKDSLPKLAFANNTVYLDLHSQ